MLLSGLVILLSLLLPLMNVASAADGGTTANLTYLNWTVGLSPASAFVLLSLTGGAGGGTLHGVASLTAHVADEDFDPAWKMWYPSNPLVGAALAVGAACPPSPVWSTNITTADPRQRGTTPAGHHRGAAGRHRLRLRR